MGKKIRQFQHKNCGKKIKCEINSQTIYLCCWKFTFIARFGIFQLQKNCYIYNCHGHKKGVNQKRITTNSWTFLFCFKILPSCWVGSFLSEGKKLYLPCHGHKKGKPKKQNKTNIRTTNSSTFLFCLKIPPVAALAIFNRRQYTGI